MSGYIVHPVQQATQDGANFAKVNIRLPEGLGERIDKLVGWQRRAAFIREVLEQEVLRLESERDAKTSGTLPDTSQ